MGQKQECFNVNIMSPHTYKKILIAEVPENISCCNFKNIYYVMCLMLITPKNVLGFKKKNNWNPV